MAAPWLNPPIKTLSPTFSLYSWIIWEIFLQLCSMCKKLYYFFSSPVKRWTVRISYQEFTVLLRLVIWRGYASTIRTLIPIFWTTDPECLKKGEKSLQLPVNPHSHTRAPRATWPWGVIKSEGGFQICWGGFGKTGITH